MARYYIKFDTMRNILSLPTGAKVSEIVSMIHSKAPCKSNASQLSVVAQAEELADVRFRSGEKPMLKAINSAPGIRFPIKVDIALPAHKRSIVMQAELGGVEVPPDDAFKKHRSQLQIDRGVIFANVHRIIRCIVDCQIYLQDGPAVRHALELGRSLGARVWESSPLQMKQVPNIGNVAVRKLVAAGVCSLEDLSMTEPSRVNVLLSRKPGFGEKVESFLRAFPKPTVSVRTMGKASSTRLWACPSN